MATFQDRKNGTITARVRRHGITLSETFKGRNDAEAWARKTESEIERGLWRDTRLADITTVSDLISDYRKKILPSLKGHGVSSSLTILNERLGKTITSKLTTKQIADYRDRRLTEVGNETVRKELQILSKMIDLANLEWGLNLQVNPCKSVTKPPPSKSRNRRLSQDEEICLLAELRRCRSPYIAPLAQFALETAARQGELLALKWKDVNKDRLHCIFFDTKNGDDRAAPLSQAALSILEKLPRQIKNDRVFPVSSSLVGQAWGHAVLRARRKYVKQMIEAGHNPDEVNEDNFMKDLHFHDLRHEAISRMAEKSDFNVLELAAISGHKTLEMLKRYTHLQAEKLAKKLG